MVLIFRWMVRLAGTLIAVSVLAVLGIYFLASRSLPEYDKELAVSGLDARLEIVRDNANVPHILGASDADVFFGLGYAHAQDRLWQMMTLRRTVQGRLSEVFGTRTVEIDTVMRHLDLYPLAQAAVPYQDERTQMALSAYARGVNARLQEINENALGRGAPEMFLFDMPIAPWQPADSIAMIKLMALRLSGQVDTEVLRARTSLRLPAERLIDILPDAPGTGVVALPRYAQLLGGELPQLAAIDGEFDPLSPFGPARLAGASNAWAAAGSRSAAGGTLLASDPHMGFSAPGAWYLARLELQSGGVIGATIPGIPAVLSGRSDALGWGITAAYMDDQDLFIEQLNPENSNEYRTPTGFKPFRTRQSILQVAEEKPITLTLRWSDNGPILPPDFQDVGSVTPKDHVAALGWSALTTEDTSASAAINLMSAQTVDEAMQAGEAMIAPALNLVLVDSRQIAMKTLGRMPRRQSSHQTKGRMPSPGWIATNRWQGSLSYAANPESKNPIGGILGNTNNKTVDRPFPLHVSYDWGDTQRIQRWTRLMQGRQVHTRDSFIETQLDTVSPAARTLLPLIGAELWFTGEAAPEGTTERRRQRALALLADWNGEMNEHLPEPMIYSAWVRALQERLIRDDLGPLADEFMHMEPLFIERVFRDVDGASAWCDVIQSAPVESCSDMARLALDDALLWIDEAYGLSLESLQWGEAHEAAHIHPVLGNVPLLRSFVNIRQTTSGGDHTLMRGLSSGEVDAPYRNVHGAGYRGVYDFADPDSSVFVIATGQSGHFLSRYYDDLGELWRRGEYIPMSLDTDLARAAAVGVTILTPK
ncbi:penicillin acylase family protein [Thalassovita mediterranea]|jgi:penicillin amidase|uniref:Acyl-homoserine lactone acylase QuiP n=1 Tax=Thalassovita mediterranea TaxID=340021 RepID=A0A0P1GLF9_9RHOB|nr:penicillin acylase family protein [Thalassovita mediterranea]CUH83158.1 Acyl-homoserine lactone acylase QuiP precursor [Thalassovita mediterranea]SIS33361.1 penicillin amidase [Thalassovita mediterranea]